MSRTDGARLDYRFGWRWLLPDVGGLSPVMLRGLDAEEQRWWLNASGAQLVDAGTGQARGLLVDVDKAGAVDCRASELEWVAAWGSGAGIARLRAQLVDFGSCSEYALLPHALPRVVVPLASHVGRMTGLRLHKPGRRLARLAVMAAAWLSRIGSTRLLRGRVLLIARRHAGPPQGLRHVVAHDEIRASDFALYLGTPSENRKTVALPVGARCILKAGATPQACQALRHEAGMLVTLSRSGVARQVPRLLDLVDQPDSVIVFQEYRLRTEVALADQDQMAVDFLVRLTVETGAWRRLQSWLDEQDEPAEAPLWRQAWARLRARAAAGDSVALCQVHGDFAPWNCMVSSQGFFVFDWECGQARGLQLADAFYYVLSSHRHVATTVNVDDVLRQTLAFATRVADRVGLGSLQLRLQLMLWLVLQSPHVPLYQQLLMLLMEEQSDE